MGDDGAAWIVTGQQEAVERDANNQFTTGMKITFQLRNGQPGSVFVRNEQYTQEAVRAAINAKAAQLNAIGELRG